MGLASNQAKICSFLIHQRTEGNPFFVEGFSVRAVALAAEAMVWEYETDGNPSVDASELPNDKVTEPKVAVGVLMTESTLPNHFRASRLLCDTNAPEWVRD